MKTKHLLLLIILILPLFGFPQTTWTGVVDNNWFNPGNWDAGVPNAATDAIISFDTLEKAPEIYLGDAFTNKLTISAGAYLTLSPTGTLTINGIFENDGDFIVYSDSTGKSGSLIDNGIIDNVDTLIIGTDTTFYYGIFRIWRNMTDVFSTGYGWHYVSPPIDSAVSLFFAGCWLQGWFEDENNWWDVDPNNGDWSTFKEPVEVMKGYSVKKSTAFCGALNPESNTIEFNTNNVMRPGGKLNTGTISVDVTASDFNGTTLDNWNLIGNPYVSSLNWELVTVPAGLNNTIYYWNPDVSNYVWYTQGIGGTGSQYIPSSQGFFVKATADDILTVQNSARTHLGADVYYKSEINDLLVLKVSGNNRSDETWIHLDENATTGFDGKYDAYKMFTSNGTVPQIFSIADELNLALNSLPSKINVPLGFVCGTSGEYSIKVNQITDFNCVVLEDLKENVKIDLLVNPEYSFSYSTLETENRFIVHFEPLSVDELKTEDIKIFSDQNNVCINFPFTEKGQCSIYDVTGKEIIRKAINKGLNTIQLAGANSCYLVKVKSSVSITTKKICL